MPTSKKAKKQQVHSIFCPNCGIPRNAREGLKKYMRTRNKVKFICHSCGISLDFVKPGTGPKKEKKEEEFSLTGKELKGVTKAASALGKLLK